MICTARLSKHVFFMLCVCVNLSSDFVDLSIVGMLVRSQRSPLVITTGHPAHHIDHVWSSGGWSPRGHVARAGVGDRVPVPVGGTRDCQSLGMCVLLPCVVCCLAWCVALHASILLTIRPTFHSLICTFDNQLTTAFLGGSGCVYDGR